MNQNKKIGVFLLLLIITVGFSLFLLSLSSETINSLEQKCNYTQEPNYVWTYTESPAGRCFEVWQRTKTLTNGRDMKIFKIPCDEVPEGKLIKQ